MEKLYIAMIVDKGLSYFINHIKKIIPILFKIYKDKGITTFRCLISMKLLKKNSYIIYI